MILDYSMMQWVLSVVLGVSLTRFINTVTQMARKRDGIKFDFLLVGLLISMILTLTTRWFRAPGAYTSAEGQYIPFMLLFLMDLSYVVAFESVVPNLEFYDSPDLKEIYFKQKDLFFVTIMLLGLAFLVLYIFYSEIDVIGIKLNSSIATISFNTLILIILPIFLIVSNNYYLHAFNMILVILGIGSELLTYAVEMK